jgi:hypothetical protein
VLTTFFLALQALLARENPTEYILTSAFEMVLTSELSLTQAVQFWKLTSDLLVPADGLELLLSKIKTLREPMAEEIELCPLSYYPPPTEGVSIIQKRNLQLGFRQGVDLETAIQLAEIYGRQLHFDVRSEEVRGILLQAGVRKKNFVHFA